MKEKLKFYRKISNPDSNGCMNWLGAKTRNGYGTLTWNKKPMTLAHRLSYKLHKGSIPENMCVCHTCDNPSCVNPDHLWIGTIAENNQDMVNKDRQHLKKGMRLSSKLTELQIKDIRNKILQGITMVELSKVYGVSDRTINNINSGKLWPSIDTKEHRLLRLKKVKEMRSKHSSKLATKLTIEQIKEIKIRLSNGEGQKNIGLDYGVSQFCIYEIKHGRRWKDI